MEREPGGPPRYVALAAVIRAEIISGALAPGDRIPSEPALVDEYDVSKTTATRALDMLAAEGLVVRRSGAGSFVREHGIARSEVAAPRGTRVTARWPRPGELAGLPPGVTALAVAVPGEPEAVYPADRTVIVFR